MQLCLLFVEYDRYILPPRPVISRPLSQTTARNYRCRVRRFLSSLPATAVVADLSRQVIHRYLRSIHQANPFRMAYAAISHYCNWLISEGWLRENPAKGIPLPKPESNRRKPVPEDAVSRLLDACDRLPVSCYKQALARAAISLLIFGALRRGECVLLEIRDFDTDTGEVVIRKGKGDKQREIVVCKECTDAVSLLLEMRPKDCTHNFLLAQSRTQGLGYTGLRSILRRAHTVAGLPQQYTPHQLRHSCASRMVENGADIRDVQAFLGHANLSTTELYIHSAQKRMQALAHLASLSAPKANAPASPTVNQERRRVAVRRLR